MRRCQSGVGPVVLLLLAHGVPAIAGPAEEPSGISVARAARIQPEPDFLFGRPGVAIGIRALWARARAHSDIFTFVTDQLTLSTDDFNAPGVALDVGFPIGSRLDVLAGVEFARASASSEDRRHLEDNGLPIRQETTLNQVDLTGSLEFALVPRGRSIGRYAWITSRATPYVGAGGGLLWYRFEQAGDFVDSLDPGPELPIIVAQLVSDGWTVGSHIFAGVDVKVTRRLLVTTEVRYRWADATMSQHFVGFEPIDLSGLRVGFGIQLLF